MPAIKFRGVDFLQYDSLLTDEEKLVRDTTRQFIEDNLIPIIEECNRAGRFPKELVKPMAELGFFGASLKGYGCAGMGNVEYGLMTQELERGDSGVRSFVSVQSGLCMGESELRAYLRAGHVLTGRSLAQQTPFCSSSLVLRPLSISNTITQQFESPDVDFAFGSKEAKS